MPNTVLDYHSAVRNSVGGLKAEKKGGVPFPVKSAKDLMLKLRKALDEHNCAITVSRAEPYTLPYTEDKNGNNVTNFYVSVELTFHTPAGTMVFCGLGGGSSTDDKALGKASTYAFKDAVVKGFTLPDDDMVDTDDESVPQKPKYNFGKKA